MTTVDKKRNFITSKSDASEEQEIIPTGGVGEIPAEDSSVSMADILGDCDDENDAEEVELDDFLECLGQNRLVGSRGVVFDLRSFSVFGLASPGSAWQAIICGLAPSQPSTDP